MTFERRDFLRAATTGFAFALADSTTAFAQASRGSSKGELEGGTSSVELEGQLKAGMLRLRAQDFIDDRDRALIMRGKLGSVELYCSMFSHRHDRTIFALLRTDDHSTMLVLSDTNDPKIGQFSVWNDDSSPENFRIDKDKFVHTLNVNQSIVQSKGTVDLVGKRKPPEFTAQELVAVFGDNPALVQFLRGRKPYDDPPPVDGVIAWGCRFLSLVPGSLFALAWVGRG